jgi:hypothetical protein
MQDLLGKILKIGTLSDDEARELSKRLGNIQRLERQQAALGILINAAEKHERRQGRKKHESGNDFWTGLFYAAQNGDAAEIHSLAARYAAIPNAKEGETAALELLAAYAS